MLISTLIEYFCCSGENWEWTWLNYSLLVVCVNVYVFQLWHRNPNANKSIEFPNLVCFTSHRQQYSIFTFCDSFYNFCCCCFSFNCSIHIGSHICRLCVRIKKSIHLVALKNSMNFQIHINGSIASERNWLNMRWIFDKTQVCWLFFSCILPRRISRQYKRSYTIHMNTHCHVSCDVGTWTFSTYNRS